MTAKEIVNAAGVAAAAIAALVIWFGVRPNESTNIDGGTPFDSTTRAEREGVARRNRLGRFAAGMAALSTVLQLIALVM